MIRRVLLFLLLVLAAQPAASAVDPGELLPDPALEGRARQLTRQLRCVVCQNQSIDDSNAPLARDVRRLVRERLTAGDSDAQVLAFAVARYGDFVLLSPPVKPLTWLRWFGPALVLVAGGVCMLVRARRPPPREAVPLTAEERAKLAALAGDGPS